MDCGDAGHILLSRHVADDLEQYRASGAYLHDLGECEVKHDVRIDLANLYTAKSAMRSCPKKRQAAKRHRTRCALGGSGDRADASGGRARRGGSLFFAQRHRRVRSPLPWKKASRCFRSKI